MFPWRKLKDNRIRYVGWSKFELVAIGRVLFAARARVLSRDNITIFVTLVLIENYS